MDRSYRQEINLLLLQTFGLGATRVGSGRLESIPTNFNLSDWPTPNEPTTPSTRSASRTDQGAEEVTWQELLPLLQRRSVRYKKEPSRRRRIEVTFVGDAPSRSAPVSAHRARDC